MAQTNQQPLQTALVYGLVSGMALGVGEIALGLSTAVIPYPLVILVGRLSLVLLVLAYLYAGYQAARRTGKVFAGTLAGAFTGVFGVLTIIFLLYVVAFIGSFFLLNPLMLLGIPTNLLGASVVLSPLVSIILTFAAYGAIAGTFAGYIGKQRALH